MARYRILTLSNITVTMQFAARGRAAGGFRRFPKPDVAPLTARIRQAAMATETAPKRSIANEEFPMTDTANHLAPEQGRFRRALAAVSAWLQALDYTSFDYTLDRIERLEREVGRLREELRQNRDSGPVDAHNGSAAAVEH